MFCTSSYTVDVLHFRDTVHMTKILFAHLGVFAGLSPVFVARSKTIFASVFLDFLDLLIIDYVFVHLKESYQTCPPIAPLHVYATIASMSTFSF